MLILTYRGTFIQEGLRVSCHLPIYLDICDWSGRNFPGNPEGVEQHRNSSFSAFRKFNPGIQVNCLGLAPLQTLVTIYNVSTTNRGMEYMLTGDSESLNTCSQLNFCPGGILHVCRDRHLKSIVYP